MLTKLRPALQVLLMAVCYLTKSNLSIQSVFEEYKSREQRVREFVSWWILSSAGDSARTKGTIVMVIDAHVPHVPAFIINWVLGVMAPFAHKQIKTLLQNEFDDPSKLFPKRMAENEYLYNKVRQTVKEGLERHYGPELAAKAVGL